MLRNILLIGALAAVIKVLITGHGLYRPVTPDIVVKQRQCISFVKTGRKFNHEDAFLRPVSLNYPYADLSVLAV